LQGLQKVENLKDTGIVIKIEGDEYKAQAIYYWTYY